MVFYILVRKQQRARGKDSPDAKSPFEFDDAPVAQLPNGWRLAAGPAAAPNQAGVAMGTSRDELLHFREDRLL